jgi:hypothetical protein
MANIKPIKEALDASDAEKYRLLQAEKMIATFTKTIGRPPHNSDELGKFIDGEVKAGRFSTEIS